MQYIFQRNALTCRTENNTCMWKLLVSSLMKHTLDVCNPLHKFVQQIIIWSRSRIFFNNAKKFKLTMDACSNRLIIISDFIIFISLKNSRTISFLFKFYYYFWLFSSNELTNTGVAANILTTSAKKTDLYAMIWI